MSKSILYNYTKEQLQDLLDHSNSYGDILRKIGLNPKGRNPDNLKRIIKEYNLSEEKLNENRSNFYKVCAFKTKKLLEVSSEEFFADGASHSSKLIIKRLLEEGLKEYKCEICGISEWQNKKITLQLHHKDGKHSNNQLDNLQLLCPNCHSQTDTFAGKKVNRSRLINRCIICGKELKNCKSLRCPQCTIREISRLKKESKKIHREELKLLVRTVPFVKIGKKFGVSDNTIRKWCKSYKLPYRAKDIKSISDEEWEKI